MRSLNHPRTGRLFCLLIFLGWAFPLFAQETPWGVVLGESVNLRQAPDANSMIAGKINKDMELVQVLNASLFETIKTVDPTQDHQWFEIRSPGGGHGYIFGFYLARFPTEEKARQFIEKNVELRKKLTGSWKYTPSTTEIFSPYFDIRFTFHANGTHQMTLEGNEGDHIAVEKGEGRYYLASDSASLRIYANMTGNAYPDGMSWKEYFKLGHNRLPDKQELAKFIKEREAYHIRYEFIEPADRIAEVFSQK